MKILCGKRVHIVPKPHKTEYNNCKDFMKLWGKSESEYPLLKVFLNPNADVKFGGNHADFVRSGNGMHRATAMRIRQRLNEKQVRICKWKRDLIYYYRFISDDFKGI